MTDDDEELLECVEAVAELCREEATGRTKLGRRRPGMVGELHALGEEVKDVDF